MNRSRKRRLKSGTNIVAKPASEVTLVPPPWDFGATGPANRRGLEIEDAAEDEVNPQTGEITRRNPNGVKRARRVDMLEVWHRKGAISTGGFNAAVALRNVFEQTARAPGWPDNDRVQSSPKPDHSVTIQIDRISKYHLVARLVHRDDWEIIDLCVLQERIPASLPKYRGRSYQDGLATLRAALDRLAERLNPPARARA